MEIDPVQERQTKISPPPGGEVGACERSENASGGGITSTPPARSNSACASPDRPPRVGGGEIAERIVAAARGWIGTPYVHQASVKCAGCDCLGLLRGVWRELVGEEPEAMQPYSPDWAEATGEETLYAMLARHLDEIACELLAPGDIALFRMVAHGPAKHCGIMAERDGALTIIHSRQNKRVSEELLTPTWRRKLVYAFRMR